MAEVPEKVLELLDILAEEVMLAEPSDAAGMKTLRDGFQELADALPKGAPSDMVRLVGACRAKLEKMISGEVPGPQGLEALSRALGVLQPALRDGTPLRLPPEANAPWRLPENVDAEMFSEFLSSQPANLDEAERLLLLLEAADNPEAVAALRRLVHTLKGETAILGLTPVEELCHVAEDRLRDGYPRDNGEVFFSLIDWLRQVFSALEANKPLPPSGSLMELLSQPFAQAEAPAPAPEPAPAPAPAQGGDDADDEAAWREMAAAMASGAAPGETPAETPEAETPDAPEAETAPAAPEVSEAPDVPAAGQAPETPVAPATTEPAPAVDETGEISEADEPGAAMAESATPESAPAFEVGEQPGEAPEATQEAAPAAEAPAATANEISEEKAENTVAGTAAETPAPEAPEAIEAPAEPAPAPSAESVEKTSPRPGTTPAAAGTADDHDSEETHEAPAAPAVDPLEAAMAAVTQSSSQKSKKAPTRAPRPAPAPAPSAPAAASSTAAADAAAMAIATGAREPIRVNAERLDRMIDAIGELGIAESMVSRLIREPDRDPQALFRYTSILSKITRELQQVSMALRMVPVRSLFHKMARLVHNLSHLSGKQLELVTEGEDTELDRTLVNCVGEALVHMVRNSVDHGIERDAAARMEAGKPIVGRITLRAYNRSGSICVAISDDGRGLDRDAIYRKAVEKGLLSPGAVLTDAEVFRQIFVPGFSTQDEVTAISGRGVGMDVVRRNIERMHGHVDVESEPGKGTTFVLRVPLTLASIDGMVVGVGGERYIIPTSSIRRTVQLSQGSVVTVAGRGELLLDEGMELPLCRLREILFPGPRPPRTYEGIAMVVETEGHRMAFLVEKILEQQQIVIKSLGNVVRIAGIAGGTIMADGRVGLILDVAGLMEMVNGNGSAGI